MYQYQDIQDIIPQHKKKEHCNAENVHICCVCVYECYNNHSCSLNEFALIHHTLWKSEWERLWVSEKEKLKQKFLFLFI